MTEPTRLVAAVAGRPDVAALLIEGSPETGATLVRYAPEGAPAGEVWYGSAEEAQLCAARDYGAALGPWHPVPDGTADPLALVSEAGPPGAGPRGPDEPGAAPAG